MQNVKCKMQKPDATLQSYFCIFHFAFFILHFLGVLQTVPAAEDAASGLPEAIPVDGPPFHARLTRSTPSGSSPSSHKTAAA